ncbi:MAG: alkyl sulfatase dimerization domain-containing protein [Bacillota bacterium]
MSIAKLEQSMQTFKQASKEVPFEKVREGYYFTPAFGNVGVVITDEGVVVIDSTLSKVQAEGILDKIKTVTEQPIKYLIYTHGHIDHVGGASVFKKAGAKIIAHRNVINRLDKYQELDKFHYLINKRQFATNFEETRSMNQFEYPEIVYDQEYVLPLGGKTFHLMHGKGETDDASIIHIPEDDVVFTGDFIVRSFPNVGNPAKDIRYAKEWAQMMGRIRDLHPKITIPGHGPVITDTAELDKVTTGFQESMSFVQESVVRCLNEGKSLEEMLEEIKLPSHLEQNPYLQQFYGCLDFAIRGTHRRYTGWYDGNPTNLLPEKESDISQAIVGLIGDESKILEQAKTLLDQNRHRLVLHLVDLIIQADGKEKNEAIKLKVEVLLHLSENEENYMRKNIYANAAQELTN